MIWSQPFTVIGMGASDSELLRLQQGVKQIDHQPRTYDQHDDRFNIHGISPQRMRSQNLTYAMESRKKTTVTATKMASRISCSPVVLTVRLSGNGVRR